MPGTSGGELNIVNRDEKTRVLLIEDNPGDQRLIQEMLAAAEDDAFRLTCVDNLAAGLAHLTAERVDVVLLDLLLPDSVGLDTFVRTQAHASHVPIVVLTNLDDENVGVQAVQRGAQDYLLKDEVDGSLLVRAMRYAIERKRAEEALQQHRDRLEGIAAERAAELRRTIAQLRREIAERKQAESRLQIQREIDAAILANQSPQDIASAVLRRLADVIPYLHASVCEVDMAQQRGRDVVVLNGEGTVALSDLVWHPLSAAGELVETIQQGRIHQVRDVNALETPSILERRLAAIGAHAYISVPLYVQDALVGTLNLTSDAPGFFQPEHIEILQGIATSLAVSLQHANFLEQAQRNAETKALLLREVSHRVKNNLNAIIGLLYVERRHAPPEALAAYRAIMENLTQRIMGLAQVHRMLSDVEWAPLRVSDLAEQIIHTTVLALSPAAKVKVAVSDCPVCVTPDNAHHLALVLVELTNNTLRHGVTGRAAVQIVVHIVQQGEGVTLVYRDDGPGFPEAVLSRERCGAGMEIIEEIVGRNLRGELTLRNDSGAVTEICFESVL